ncbi:MAG: hypothetical protein ABI346_05235 [Candidatus Baltobacteraceae bacterium]
MLDRPRVPFVPIAIALTVIAALALAWKMYGGIESARSAAARRVLAQRSEIRLSLRIDHTTGKIAREEYRIADLDGLSTAEYRVLGRSGTLVRVQAPARKTKEYGSDVAFLFGKVVQDGIWELGNRPPRGDTSKRYTVYVYQLVEGKAGSRTYSFTDPHYWATTGGHQYHLTLDKNKPLPDLVKMQSTTLVEPRYGAIVADFEGFGSPAFRKAIAAQRARMEKRT